MTQRLIIFEIDGILACKLGPGQFTDRPHLKPFLNFMFDNFKIAIWTSYEQAQILKEYISEIFGEHYKDLLFIWYLDKCTESYYKSLNRVWESDLGKNYSKANTLLVDSSGFGVNNPKRTVFSPKKWICDMNDESLKNGGEIMTWFRIINEEKGTFQEIIKRGD